MSSPSTSFMHTQIICQHIHGAQCACGEEATCNVTPRACSVRVCSACVRGRWGVWGGQVAVVVTSYTPACYRFAAVMSPAALTLFQHAMNAALLPPTIHNATVQNVHRHHVITSLRHDVQSRRLVLPSRHASLSRRTVPRYTARDSRVGSPLSLLCRLAGDGRLVTVHTTYVHRHCWSGCP